MGNCIKCGEPLDFSTQYICDGCEAATPGDVHNYLVNKYYGWKWHTKWQSYQKDNGQIKVMINKRLFGLWAVQRYAALDEMGATHEVKTYDLHEAFKLGEEFFK